MEEYSGAYMRLLHNVFRVNLANIVLASDTPTTPVQADRDVTLYYVQKRKKSSKKQMVGVRSCAAPE